MKTISGPLLIYLLVGAGLLWAAPSAAGQPTQNQTINVPAPTPFAETGRDANSSVWERTVYEPGPDGQVVARKRSYNELATGLHFWSNGQWLDSKEEIDILPNGTAVATNGQHQASFPGDIYQGVIELVTPDGQHLKSRPLGLSYYDGTHNVLIAELTNSIGVVAGNNVVIYQNAFTDFKADIRLTYTKAGFEQDIILRSQIPTPESFGLDPQKCVLEVETEFFNTADPVQTAAPVNPQNGLSDSTLTFGKMKMMQGRAFYFDDSTKGLARVQGALVYKSWQHPDGRTILYEDVPVTKLSAQLAQLPLTASAGTNGGSAHLAWHKVSDTRLLPPFRPAQTGTSTVRLAKADINYKSGVVLDYVTINAYETDQTFQGDTTYFVNGDYWLLGTTVIEGGTVIKYASTNESGFFLVGPVVCDTAPYRPAVFTIKDDNSVGEPISGSTGSPIPMTSLSYPISYGGQWYTNNGIPVSFHDLNMRYLYSGIIFSYYGSIPITNELKNCQFSSVYLPIIVNGALTNQLNVRNVLVYNADWAIYGQNQAAITGEQMTFHDVNYMNNQSYPASVSFTNSLFISVTNWGSAFTAYNCATNASDAGVFQTVGAGSHYLATNSIYRNAGTTNIDPEELAEIQTKTTYPPVVYTSTNFATPTTFSPQAQRDTDTPDLGYLYDPLDYVFSGVEAVSNITFTAGTAVGWYDLTYAAGYGIKIDNDATVAFNGTVTAPCWLARYDVSQEGGTSNWTNVGWGFALTSNGGNDNYTADSPQVTAQFTKFSSRNFDDQVYRDYNGFLVVQANNCEFWEPGEGGYCISTTYSNCLFFRTAPYVYDAYGVTGCSFTMVNCTLEGGILNPLYIQHHAGATWPVIIYNCAFDGTTYTVDTNGLVCDYNAYLTGAAQLPVSGAHDMVLTSGYNWQSSWFGNYYLPTNSPVIDKGSTNANVVGLYHFTTQTNQMKETNSVVDIGYHYVATDAYGVPIDTNGDGIPDYLEDANGNGQVDSGEIGWNIVGDLGLKVLITRPRNGSTLP